MARARNIKPDFFTDEDIVELQPLTRLMFIGMWTLADRRGRMEDRPKQIKLRLLPVDDHDVNAALDELQQYNFIQRYKIDGKSFIQIRNFNKHQSPHKDEKESTIPPPPETTQVQTPDKHGASTVQTPDKHGALRPDCLNLIPDCLNLIPDCLNLIDDSLIPDAVVAVVDIATGDNTQTPPATAAEKKFRDCFSEHEARLLELYPHADYEVERETCIAHYRKQTPPLDPYPVILKWFNRIPKPLNKGREPPKTFEQIRMSNTERVMKEFVEEMENDRSRVCTIRAGDGESLRSIPG